MKKVPEKRNRAILTGLACIVRLANEHNSRGQGLQHFWNKWIIFIYTGF